MKILSPTHNDNLRGKYLLTSKKTLQEVTKERHSQPQTFNLSDEWHENQNPLILSKRVLIFNLQSE